MKVTIHRSDYNGAKDSSGMEYFDYILHQLKVPEEDWKEIDTIELDIENFELY